MDSTFMTIGYPLTAEPDAYPSWPNLKYPGKKTEINRALDPTSRSSSFSSISSRPSAPSRNSSATSLHSDRIRAADAPAPPLPMPSRQVSSTRNQLDDTITSSYLSASGSFDSSEDLFRPPTMATSPLSQQHEDKMSPLQQCIAAFSKQDKEYNPPFKIPSNPSSDVEEPFQHNNRRPPRNRVKVQQPSVASNLSTYTSGSSTSEVSLVQSQQPKRKPSVNPYKLTPSEVKQVMKISAEKDAVELEDDPESLLLAFDPPTPTRRMHHATTPGVPKGRAVHFTPSSTRYYPSDKHSRSKFDEDYEASLTAQRGQKMTTKGVDQPSSRVVSARSSASSHDVSTSTSSFLNYLDANPVSRTATGRVRSCTSASAPPDLPTVIESDERVSPHTCDDFASSVTSLEGNISTCASNCSIHSAHSSTDDLPRAGEMKEPTQFGRRRSVSLSGSVTEAIRKKSEGVAKRARHQWCYVTWHVRLKAFQAKNLVKKKSFKSFLGRSSKADLKQEV